MLFLLNGDGTMTRLDSGRIFQGSNNATELGVIYPYAGVSLAASFTLPNGITTNYTPMPPLSTYTLKNGGGDVVKTFENLFYTSIPIPNTVTALQGVCKVTVAQTAVSGTGAAGSIDPAQVDVNTSYSANFTVEYAALPVYTVPDDPTEADFQQLVELLEAYKGTISGNVTELQDRMTAAEGNITSLGKRMTTAEGEIDDLQERMTDAEDNIEQAQGDISDLKSNKQDKTDNALKTPQKTVVGAINEIYDELTDTSGTGFASRLDTAEAEIAVLESRVDDVEEKTKDPLMTDFTVDVATSTATKFYNNGTQADVTLPTGDTAERINFLTSAVFTEEQWAEQSDGTYALTIPASQTGRTNNKYVANLEVTDGSMQVVSADKFLKNEDGSITLKDFSEPWSGRVITVAAGQHSTVWHYGTAIVGTGTQTSTDLTLRASVLVGDFYLNTETSQCYVCTALPENASTWQYLANLQGTQGDKGDTGAPFAIYKTYVSVAAMNADAANVPDGAFVLIETGNVDDEDNSKLYVRTTDGTSAFEFVTDLSGAQGIKGDNGTTFTPAVDTNGNLSWTNNGGLSNPTTVNIKGQKGDTGLAATIQIGTVTTLPAGSQATVENVGTDTDAIINFGIPQGAQGEKGGTYVAQIQTSNGEPLQVTAEQIAQNTEFGISNAQNWSAFSQEDIALVNVIVTDNANKAALVIMQIDAPPTPTLITGRVVYVQYEASGGGGGGLQVQEITYANGDSVGTTAAKIAAIASSHNIVGCITDQSSEMGISYTVNGLTYDVMNIIPAVDKSGTLYINGYSIEVTSGTAVTFVTVVVTSSRSLTYANGLEVTAFAPNTATTWTRNGSIFVYYQ